MAEPHVITALTRKYTEILAVVRERDAQTARLRDQLLAISKTLSLYQPDFDGSTLSPKRTYRRNEHFPRGMFHRMVMDILREAKRPLSTGELARMALERQGAPTDTPTVEQFARTLGGALVRYAKVGRVIVHGDERPKRWEIRQT